MLQRPTHTQVIEAQNFRLDQAEIPWNHQALTNTKTMETQIRFNSEHERKQYAAGMAIVRAKIGKAHVPTFAERQATDIKEGRLLVLKKLGAVGFRKCFGIAPPAVAAKAPARTLAVSTPATGRTLHRYAVRGGLFG